MTEGQPIQADQAWRMFSEWQSTGTEIGVVFYGSSGTSIFTMGFIEGAHSQQVLLRGDLLRASFHLKHAAFRYGPVPTWPRWPSPPIVEVNALQVQFENGDWLALADGLKPNALPPRALPA